MFQPGFGLGQRATNFLYKGAVFSVIGMGAGVIGTALSNALLLLRKRMNPAFRPQVGLGEQASGSGTVQHSMGQQNVVAECTVQLDRLLIRFACQRCPRRFATPRLAAPLYGPPPAGSLKLLRPPH
jgi:hypothetical protein